MDLICIEINTSQPIAYNDPVFVEDERVLKNLLSNEIKYTISSSYFKCLQSDLKPFMRKIVASWMLEVCEEERCPDEIFPLAMNIMDRFLSIVKIRKTQLQLLGSACLFLASKLKQSEPLTAHKLIYYSDKSITLDELLRWELLVLSRLKWDLAAIIPNDFINIILRRIDNLSKGSKTQMLIKKHAQTFIHLCATDFEFSMLPPSLIAAASIGTAIEGLTRINNNNLWDSNKVMLHQLQTIIGNDSFNLIKISEKISHKVETLAVIS